MGQPILAGAPRHALPWLRRAGTACVGLAALGLMSAAGCRDSLIEPTQGFLSVESSVAGVSVTLDGVAQSRTAPCVLGPLAAGMHTVRVSREFYAATPESASAMVAAAGTTSVSFEMMLQTTGSARIASTDEMTQADLSGAAILVEGAPGEFTPTGRTTPAVVDSLPPGDARFVLRLDGFADTAPFTVEVAVGDTVDASAELGPLPGVLAEMFTYQTCINCGPAADSLHAVYEDFDERFVVVEYHTGQPVYELYTDYPDAILRQHYYYPSGAPPYPSVVFNGTERVEEAQESQLSRYRTLAGSYLAGCDNTCSIALRARDFTVAGTPGLTVLVKARSALGAGEAVLRLVLIEDGILTVPALPPGTIFNFVARWVSEEALPAMQAGEIAEFSHSFPAEAVWKEESNLGVAVFVQDDATGEVLQTVLAR
ncbi:MAG: PEGA domain-containing protein [Gemmatimonadota bacterium]|nr:PEGA domain-containing protein [Gemmatimonadota bacterium]